MAVSLTFGVNTLALAQEVSEASETAQEQTTEEKQDEETKDAGEITDSAENETDETLNSEESADNDAKQSKEPTVGKETERDERLENKAEKLEKIAKLREMKELVKAAKIESLTYLKEMRSQFNDISKDDRAEILDEIAAIKNELKDYSIDTFVNGISIDYEKYGNVLPIIENGRTLAPVRAVTEALGAEVDWNDETQEVAVIKDGIVIKMKIGSNIAYVNGEEKILDAAPEIRDDRTVVPMRFIAESFNLNVTWDENSLSIIIE